MTKETPIDDIGVVWQSQRREHPIMSADEIRLRATIVQAKVRRNLIVATALGIVLLILGSTAIIHLNDTRARIAAAAIIGLTASLAYTVYRRISPLHALSPTAGLKSCIEFYRNELEAQYRLAALTWRFLIPIVIFSLLTWSLFLRTSPLVPKLLLPSVLILILFVRHFESRKLKRMLATLDDLEKDN